MATDLAIVPPSTTAVERAPFKRRALPQHTKDRVRREAQRDLETIAKTKAEELRRILALLDNPGRARVLARLDGKINGCSLPLPTEEQSEAGIRRLEEFAADPDLETEMDSLRARIHAAKELLNLERMVRL